MKTGSTLRKWDLHVHTPASYENQYKIVGKEERGKFKNDIWEKYISELEKINDVDVIGITDYFTLDGYKKIVEYKRNGRLNNIKLFLPNIEFRLDKFVGEKRLNYHVIFSDELDVHRIEKDFLEALKIQIIGGEETNLTRENIESIGRELREQQDEFKRKSEYYIGCMNITVRLEDVIDTLKKKVVFKNKYMLVLVEPEWKLIDDWKGQDHLTRKNILIQSDGIFSGNEQTKEWALGKKHRSVDEFVSEFGSLKPCIHGSDAHCFEKLCKPDKNRCCWIKSDTTFEGLKQILYEPEDRVVISSDNPESVKNIYSLKTFEINKCEINDDLSFKGQVLGLNRNLVTVIGGKGSGKTAILDLIANCFIDRCYRNGQNVRDKNSFVQRIEGDYSDIELKVQFIDPDDSEFSKKLTEETFFTDVKITYLPQGQIEEFSGKREALNRKIKEVIFNNKEIMDLDFKSEFEKIAEQIQEMGEKVQTVNVNICKLEQESTDEILKEVETELKQRNGELKNKEAQLRELTERMSLEAQNKIGGLREKEEEIERKHLKIEAIQFKCTGLSMRLEEFEKEINDGVKELNERITEIIKDVEIPNVKLKEQLTAIKKVVSAVIKEDAKLTHELNKIKEELKKLEGFEQIQAELLANIRIIKEEKKEQQHKLNGIQGKKRKINTLEKDRIANYINMLVELLELKKIYKNMIDTFSVGKSEIMSDIGFESSIYFDKEDFIDTAETILDQRQVVHVDIKELAFMLEQATLKDSKEEIKTIVTSFAENALKNRSFVKKRVSKSQFYEWVFKNYFSQNTQIFFKGIPMDKLSIGQKGTVLLKLILAEGDYPIIVDMPEENLDNMFIYDELVDAFRQAKTKRQVIVATNNANLVINTDAEQLIIAQCKDNEISYKIGTIEDKSIRKEITTILEGGEEALVKREKKYGI